MPIDGLADGWDVWTEQPESLVLVYRPDVFDSSTFPAPCLPTVYVTRGRRTRRPGRRDPDPEDPWIVTLYLEPDVKARTLEFDDRETAQTEAVDLAEAFAAGDIDYRSRYESPREGYLDRLDALTGRET